MRKLLLALFLLIPFVSVHADTGVTDDGGFFKPETVEKANGYLKQAREEYGKELVIDTFAAIPDSRKAEWETAKDDAKKRADFFSSWIGETAHEKKVNGVYVLIVKDPGHLEVKRGAKTKVKAFTESNQNTMKDILLTSFKTKDYDEGLEKGVQYFRTTLRENLGAPGQAKYSASPAEEQFKHPQNSSSATNTPSYAPRTTSGGSVVWIIIVIIGAFLLIRILSNLGGPRNYGGPGQGPGYGGGMNSGQGGNFGTGYGGGGGGGFFRNVLGGMLGGAAGGYLYDRFRDRNDGVPPQQGGGYTPDNTGSSGGNFGSSSPSSNDDQGAGFGGGGSSGDFGGSSDSGSSFDSGGSSDSGGGGGGDSGSSGGDF